MAKSNDLDWTSKEVFTTGEAAEICKVSLQTIIRCFDTGRLRGFRVPGSRFRRIPRSELIRFLKSNHIPTDALENSCKRVLVVNGDDRVVTALRDRLGRDDQVSIRSAATAYDAGLLTERFRPHLIVLDDVPPHIDARQVCERLRSSPDLKPTKIVVLSDAMDEKKSRSLRKCADSLVAKPFAADDLAREIEALLVA